ncbi:MAG: dTDP-6-deoxy-3,4-keto-hexulose isomerase [Saprospiraceae bacterium]
MNDPTIVTGGRYEDKRGVIRFVNNFDMLPIRRFYQIQPINTNEIRAWQGHQKEQKWFHVTKGTFLIKGIKIDNWQQPSQSLKIWEFKLSAKNPQILHLPAGYVNGFQALSMQASIMIFSDKTLPDSIADDYRFPPDYWFDWNNNIRP